MEVAVYARVSTNRQQQAQTIDQQHQRLLAHVANSQIGISQGIETFCQRIQPTLEQLTFD